ncbi:acyl-CoA carboxylase subunit epsilon [Streptacidiphilus anmyonensis]|uniref:acyl-CoA carboxylase subunit epsilon n=1 Tax=Streptacidiphilus anmyonensis TaxID=405782 RepID=UPI0005A8113B|nr:acyl-CoA carboxylase subunit epsilon [Streptacidiphilus anmyonensis]
MSDHVLPYAIRVERGCLADDETAALVAVLLARCQVSAGPAPAASGGGRGMLRPARARWRRPERAHGFHGPRSWQDLV